MEIKKETEQEPVINEDANYTLTMTGAQFRTIIHDLKRAELHDLSTYEGKELYELLENKGFELYHIEDKE